MARCTRRLWDDDDTSLQCVRPDTGDQPHTHVYEHTTHPDQHDTAEETSDPC